jgi:tRNA pseudouridine38-40 synthase
MKHSYKLIIAYDGTDYHGWQRQPNHTSIDHVVRQTFLRSFCQKDLLLVGASRTDAGVHARGQVVRLRTALDLDPSKLAYVLSRALPDDISIISCQKVDALFHPQHTVVRKIYSYTFSLEKQLPMFSRYCYYFPHPLCLDRLQEALQVFVGTYDFSYFCKEQKGKNTIRTIESIALTLSECKKRYTITIVGPSFLRYMIRRIVGACLAYASQKDLSLAVLRGKLTGSDYCVKLLITAPAKGLCLEAIEYKKVGE